jgi:hypothetical protein
MIIVGDCRVIIDKLAEIIEVFYDRDAWRRDVCSLRRTSDRFRQG